MNANHAMDLEQTARRRAGMKMGWYIHASVYLAVNLLLGTVAVAGDRPWALFPALGWAVGLAIHGIVVFFVAGSGLKERMVEHERRQLLAQRDPW